MKVSKLQTKNRNRINIEELHALNSAYGDRVASKEVLTLVGLPALVLGLFMFLLTYRWWTTLIAIVIGAVWGYKVILPKVIQRRYEDKSLRERNRFLLTMSQSMSNKNKTVLDCLDYVTFRIGGELKEDLKKLTGTIRMGADQNSVRIRLKLLTEKYSEDPIFGQYLQQLETNIFEGNNNVDALFNISEQHNLMLSKRNDFFEIKRNVLNGVKIMVSLMLGIIIFFHGVSYIMNGDLDLYISGFTHHISGYIATPIFFIIFIKVMKKYVESYFDDSVTELQVKTKK